MDSQETIDVKAACQICGCMKVTSRDGYLYCLECGTRAADSQPILDYDIEFCATRLIKAKVKQDVVVKEDPNKFNNAWTTWHGYNLVMIGLTDEIAQFCVNPHEFRKTVLKVWGMFLKTNRIAFFSRKLPKLPALSYGLFRRDLEIIYNMKTKVGKKRRKTEIKGKSLRAQNLMLKKHFIKSSQASTMPSQLQTLADVNQVEDDNPAKIPINRTTGKLLGLKRGDSKFTCVGSCSNKCKCLLKKRQLFIFKRVNHVTFLSLYAILTLSLRICNEEIHLGDLLRWCREEHVSQGNLSHFFPEDMKFRYDDKKFVIPPLDFSNKKLRIMTGGIMKRIKLPEIGAPNMESLVRRYVRELELPPEVAGFAIRAANILGSVPVYSYKATFILPNYEAMAISYVIIVLKLIFGLDGVTEDRMSLLAQKINALLGLGRKKKRRSTEDEQLDTDDSETVPRVFEWKSWMKYVEYRKICLKRCHYPTKMKYDPDSRTDPELFLHHKATMKKTFDDSNKNEFDDVSRNVLQLIDDEYRDEGSFYPIFPCSLYPMSSYVEHLIPYLDSKSTLKLNRDILEEDFTAYNISFFYCPSRYTTHLRCKSVELTHYIGRKGYSAINKLDNPTGRALKMRKEDVIAENVPMSSWAEDIRFNKYREALEMALIRDNSNKTINPPIDDPDHFILNHCYTDYWVQHYIKSSKNRISSRFNVELDKNFPPSFAWLIKECADMIEMNPIDLYDEFVLIEKNLINELDIPNKKTNAVKRSKSTKG